MERPLRILTVIGARPQIIKAAAISRAIRTSFQGRIQETLLNTGQHYDANMSQVFFDELGIPYRVVDTATGDLGGPAYRKFDLEAWMPGRSDFGEVTSTSNTTDYQARRLAIRYRREGGRPQLLHTLNGTALAISRALISLLEIYQQQDGSIVLPEVLVPYVGKERLTSS